MDIVSLSKKSIAKLENAKEIESLDKSYIDLLGKNGEINLLLRSLGKLPKDERKEQGKSLNQ